jgi:hypothetical protein
MSELAEGARLEIVCVAYNGTEGSNPSLSAIFMPFARVCPPGCADLHTTQWKEAD